MERRILFPRITGSPPKKRWKALDIPHRLKMALSAAKVQTHIQMHWLNYNQKGKLSGLMTPAGTSSMLLRQQ